MIIKKNTLEDLIALYKEKVKQDKYKIIYETFKEYRIKIKNYIAFLARPLNRTNKFTKERYDIIHTNRNILNSLIPTFNKKVHEYQGEKFFASEGLMKKIYQNIVINIIEYTKAANVLEVGCGSGINLKILSDYFNNTQFYGIDQSTAGIAKATELKSSLINDKYTEGLKFNFNYKKNNENLNFKEEDAQNLGFSDESFELVYTILALEQMSNIQTKVIDQIKRVSKKYILLIEPFKDLNSTGIKYFYHKSKKYFDLDTKDIEDNEWKIIEYNSDFPNLLHLKTGWLLLKKN